jgi:tRNA pseudouridine38-40 synthase
MRRIRLTVSYVGTDWCGWQVQPNGPTVQEELQKAIHAVTGADVTVHGCGRTDSGVHALAHVSHSDVDTHVEDGKLVRALNAHLPSSIAVQHIETADPEFHARFNAIGKHYRYRILNARERNPFEEDRALFHPQRLDRKAMQVAAGLFEGEHDFRSMTTEADSQENTVRVVDRCRWAADGDLLTLNVLGTGFLYNMVRTMVGTLLWVGSGKLTPEDISRILEAKDRSQAGTVVEARGLYLVTPFYDESEYRRAIDES